VTGCCCGGEGNAAVVAGLTAALAFGERSMTGAAVGAEPQPATSTSVSAAGIR